MQYFLDSTVTCPNPFSQPVTAWLGPIHYWYKLPIINNHKLTYQKTSRYSYHSKWSVQLGIHQYRQRTQCLQRKSNPSQARYERTFYHLYRMPHTHQCLGISSQAPEQFIIHVNAMEHYYNYYITRTVLKIGKFSIYNVKTSVRVLNVSVSLFS